jgi:hypothetical protein
VARANEPANVIAAALRRAAVPFAHALLALAAPVAATPVAAQQAAPRARPRAEVRVDYLASDTDALHAGLGINVPLGTYVRVGVVGAGGVSWHDGRSVASARADVIGRFAFDPFRERRWGVSAGGGLTVRYDGELPGDRDRWRLLLAILVDLEGPRLGPLAPALQLGLGGGVRVGAIVRAADPYRR